MSEERNLVTVKSVLQVAAGFSAVLLASGLFVTVIILLGHWMSYLERRLP
jgi:hypothetical protein